MNKTKVFSVSIVLTLMLLLIFGGILNAFNPDSSIEVTKEFLLEDGTSVSQNDLPDKDFNFTVKLMLGDQEIETRSASGDKKFKFNKLEQGIYTIIETEYGSEWTVDVDGTGTESTIVELRSADEIEITITNKYEPGLGSPPGSLEVTKEFLLDGQLVTENDLAADFTFEVTVTGTSSGASYPDGITLTGLGNETLFFDNLIPGSYSVVETTTGSEWQVDVAEHQVDVAEGQIAEVTFTNNYRAAGSLEVTKEFLLDGQPVTENDLAADFAFEVTVTGTSSGASYPDGITLTGLGNETLIFDNLIPGSYSVVETTTGSEWQVDVAEHQVDVADGQIAEVTFTNNYRAAGSLEVTKEFLLDGQPVTENDLAADFAFEVTVTGTSSGASYPGGTTQLGSGNETLLFDNLIPGSYSVVETTTGSEWQVDVAEHQVDVADGQITEVTFTNSFIAAGSLEVTKDFLYPEGITEADMPADTDYSFTVELSLDGNIVATETSVDGSPIVFNNLIVGETYTATETAHGSEWSVVVGSGSAEVIFGDTATIGLENMYVPGSLEVTKDFLYPEGITEADMPADTDYSFTVELSLDGNIVATETSVDGSPIVFNNLIVGETYTATETAYGSEWTVVVGSGSAEVISGDTATIGLENMYVPGSLEVTKDFLYPEGITEADMPADTDYSFTVELSLDGNIVATETSVDGSSIVFNNLIVGETYTATETAHGSEWSVVVGSGSAEVIFGDTATIGLENMYVPGSLEVTKDFLYPEGITEADMPADTDYSFTVELSLDGNIVATETSVDGSPIVFNNLIVGTYTVTETAYGSEWTAVVAGGDVEVVSGETATFTLENMYVPGSLEVDKMFLLPDGSIAYPDDFYADLTFIVELRLDGDLIDTKVGEGNQTLTFSGLVPGFYTVIETTYGSMWEVEIGEQSVEVIAGETAAVTFINNLLTETAWAAHDVADIRYNFKGNWATYVEYERILEDEGMADIYAGQNIYVGYVQFIEVEDQDEELVEIKVYLDGWAFVPDTTNLYVQDYDTAPIGNPAPGKFDYKQTETGYEASITVPLNKFYGIHLNVYEVE